MISGLPGLIPVNIRIGGIEAHSYDRQNPEAAKIDSYNPNDPTLLKQVLETRKLVQQSFFEEIKLSEVGVKINSLTTFIPHSVIREETSTLTGLIEHQMGYLDISREHSFLLHQNEKGEIIVESDSPLEITEDISSKLNSSKHFKETFHLLNTAKKVLHSNDKTGVNDQIEFKLSVSPESISSKISMDKSPDSTTSITDLEMYHLARYGIAAQKTQTVYLGDVANYRYQK